MCTCTCRTPHMSLILFFFCFFFFKDQILELLLSFKLPVSVISGAINTLTLSCTAISPKQDVCQVRLTTQLEVFQTFVVPYRIEL